MKRQLPIQTFFAALLLQFSGCAIYTPFEVVRFWADYNTERACNAQVETFDHLPPKTARVRLMRWGYNVGPTNVVPKGTLGLGTGTWYDHLFFWKHLGAKDCPEYPTQDASPLSNLSSSIPPESAPRLPPPAPAAESSDFELAPAPQSGGELPTPDARPVVPMGYQAAPGNSPGRVTNSNWVFSKSAGTERLAKPSVK